jgi:glutamate-ammonia-ligase adenylyltransferase
MRTAHGDFPGGRMAIVGMGKLGSFELTAGSDVDLILLYDHDDDAQESDGPKPLDATRYFTRITQRLIAALSAPTAEGVLYQVDMRLRPSGNKGPVATRINAFEKYQREEAWTWEHMALTRARLICGDAGLQADAARIIADILTAPSDTARVTADVADMRTLVDKEKPPAGPWDLKHMPGGQIDIEFISQYLRLVSPLRGETREAAGLTTAETLERFAPGLMTPEDMSVCGEALQLYTELSQLIRLCIDGLFDPAQAPAGLADLIARAGDCPDIVQLEGNLRRSGDAVRAIFNAALAR